MNKTLGSEPSFDPSQLTMKVGLEIQFTRDFFENNNFSESQDKINFFEKNWSAYPRLVTEAPEQIPNIVARSLKALNLTASKKFVVKKPSHSSMPSIHEPKNSANNKNIPKPPDSSQSNTPSPLLMSSSTDNYKKTSTSTTDQNPSSQTLSSSKNTIENSSKETTPASVNSSSNEVQVSKQSVAKKSSHVSFQKSLVMDDSFKESKKMTVPEILEVFTDLDLFIERELNDISTQKRVKKIVEGRIATPERPSVVDEILKMREEFLKDKQKCQKDFERQMVHASKFQPMEEVQEEEEESVIDLEDVQVTRQRLRKIEALKQEASKQESLLTKINRTLEKFTRITEDNVASVMTIERHYLACSSRLQAAMSELQRLRDIREPLYQTCFNQSGKCVISDIMLEVKTEYFKREEKMHNEFLVVMLKYGEDVYTSNAVCINDDVRVVKFPTKFRVPDAFIDFEMRLEIYGTTFWRTRHVIRKTMLKKYGYFTFNLSDTGKKRKRFEMVEVITSQSNPLRKKVLMKICQKITADVHFDGTLRVKLGSTWYRAQAMLIGHLLEIALADDEEDCHLESIMLDLHKFDSDFIIPLVSRDFPPYTFLLRFNEYVHGTDFQ